MDTISTFELYDPTKRLAFCADLKKTRVCWRLFFTQDVSFHLSRKVSKHNIHICEPQNPHVIIQMYDSTQVCVFCLGITIPEHVQN